MSDTKYRILFFSSKDLLSKYKQNSSNKILILAFIRLITKGISNLADKRITTQSTKWFNYMTILGEVLCNICENSM